MSSYTNQIYKAVTNYTSEYAAMHTSHCILKYLADVLVTLLQGNSYISDIFETAGVKSGWNHVNHCAFSHVSHWPAIYLLIMMLSAEQVNELHALIDNMIIVSVSRQAGPSQP